ncbi:MAG: hypothetical protein R3C03_16595 [Pirellulaceae bacterium]
MKTCQLSRLYFLLFSMLVVLPVANSLAQAVIPGTGAELAEVGDDFEDEAWAYNQNLPKVYNHGDDALSKNLPLGESTNGRWHEGQKRGQPDIVARVETPPGGLVGSAGSMLLRSKITGSSHPSYQQQQDDFICNVAGRVGKIDVSRSPSVVTRVWFPPIEEWEERSGCHFAFRVSLEHDTTAISRFRRASFSAEDGVYWPGFFLNRELPKTNPDGSQTPGRFYFWMKATADSRALSGPEINQFGWWTLGISVSPEGQVHYYAKPGLEDLTAEDHVASAYPFGHHARRFRSFFFNVCSGDDGTTWSTPFIVDDPKVYVIR